MVYLMLVLYLFVGFSLFTHLGSWVEVIMVFSRRWKYRRVDGFTPPVSILKPVRGLNPGDEDNFRTFFRLDYPKYEIIFLIHEDAGDDPAIPCIERLFGEYPGVAARIHRVTERRAMHEKVNNYAEGIVEAAYDTICITDADCYVDREYLRRDVKPLSDPDVGMVTSLQTMNDFRCAPTAFEGIAQNFDGLAYWVFRYNIGSLNFIYGHSVLFRKEDFHRVKAFDEVKDHMIDDRGLGVAFADKANMRIELSRTIAHTRYTVSTWKRVGAHFIRWARFRRMYAGDHFFWSLALHYGIFWGAVTLVISLLAVGTDLVVFGVPLRTLGIVIGTAGIGVRFMSVLLGNLIFADKRRDLRYIWTVFLLDPFAVYATMRAYFISSFEHAGFVYKLQGDRMKRLEPES